MQSLQQQALAALLAGKLDAPLLFQAGKASASGWLQKQVKGKGSLLDTTEADFVVPKVTGRHAAMTCASLGSAARLASLHCRSLPCSVMAFCSSTLHYMQQELH